MQNNNPSIIDLEFEISGEKLGELELETVNSLGPKSLEIAQAIHKVILKNAWEIVSLEKLKCQIIKNLHFIDLVKIKMDFSEIGDILTPFNTIETLPNVLTDNLFGWICYNEDDVLKMFRFILDISTGEIKYLNN